MSEQADISVKHLSSIERGLTFVSSVLLEKLALALDIPVFYLFVNKRDFFYNEAMLNSIDTIIENQLNRTINEIKSEIRQGKQ